MYTNHVISQDLADYGTYNELTATDLLAGITKLTKASTENDMLHMIPNSHQMLAL